MFNIDSLLFVDVQRRPEKRCPRCDSCVYPPEYFCIRCEKEICHDPA